MLQTDDEMGPSGSVANLDTLAAEDALPDASLDDRLLRRDLKSRIFGSSTTVTIGRYEILRRIGRGGMGTVYVAHDPELDRKVALKVLRPDRRGGRDRMLHEARALARLAHPNVVTVHEVGLHDDRVFLAMELVQGQTLRAWLERSPSRSALFEVFVQAAEGLQAAHRAGLVHRDFKPDNVLIGDDGRVRVVDFGVVKTTDSLDARDLADRSDPSGASMPELTHTGQLLGTPAYMAAEQFLGQSVDARTDVFALCVALYEALAGHRPYAGEDAGQVSASVLEGSFTSLDHGDVPRDLAALVEQGLSREPDDRPRSLDGLIDALREATTPTAVAPRRRSRAVLAGLSLGLLCAGGVTALAIAGSDGSRPTAAASAPAPAADEAEDAQRAVVDEAFAAVVGSADDVSRRRTAESFLEHHGEVASASRRAIAHSILGDVLWRTSCPTATMGLCVDEQAPAPDIDRCREPRPHTLVPRPRDSEPARAALEHLDATLGLAGVEPPEDTRERALFGAAVGRARVQRLDATLEEYLGIEVPTDLDFADDPKAESLSRQAFAQYQQRINRLADELTAGYESVKRSKNPQWIIVAAARAGLVADKSAEELDDVPIPPNFDAETRPQYCKALYEHTRPLYEQARDAYAYCVDRATQHDIVLPEVEQCRARLAWLEDNERGATAP